jgi:predicted small lipoprotein YifL
MWRNTLILSLFATLAACGAKTPDVPDAGPVSACHPAPGFEGNSRNVGAYCTVGGGECSNWGPSGATACAKDLDPEGDTFCILVGCQSNAACGDDACCTGRSAGGIHACVPRLCVVDHPADACPAFPAPPDAGTPDAGS